MNLEIQTKNGCFIIIILIIILCILYIFNCIKKKKSIKKECNCNIKLDENTSYKKNIIVKQNTNNTKKNKLCLCYTEWCGHSRNFLPEWDKIKNKIKSMQELDEILDCIDYNCENNKEMCAKYKVRGYPAVLFHKENGDIINYDGPREMNEIINFVKKNL